MERVRKYGGFANLFERPFRQGYFQHWRIRRVVARKWRVRLGSTAELDFANILKWTTENFGAHQSRLYRNTLVQVIGELANGPDIASSKAKDEIMPGLRSLHIALYRTQGSSIEIVRILHDRMDLERHLPLRDKKRRK
jgi:toxin ParE1/3/4